MHRRSFLKQSGLAAVATQVPGGVFALEKPQQRIRVGQIGVSHAHATKLEAYRNSPDYEVVGIVEPSEALRQRAEKTEPFRDLKWLTREQLLATPGLQAVLVETRVKDLLSNALACVRAGMHIHIDKPAGESLAQLKQALDTAREKKLMVQMGYMYRYNPAVVMLREFLQKGWLGDIFEVHAVMSKVVDVKGRKELAEYPGGIMFEIGCHVLDLVVGILGKPQSVTPFNLHSSPIQDGLQDNMLAVLKYPKATATVKSSAMEVDGFARRHLVVCGSEGSFHIQPLDNPGAKIALSQKREAHPKGVSEVKFPKYTRYADDAADMAKVIRGEKQAAFSYQHDYDVQEALLQACGEKGDVRLPKPPSPEGDRRVAF
ncbi:MAG: Gfo/Idh/MocA family oxidoreductase [Gemmataceae bacterium]|nr:Gfo/Idh/MocA family oxidoreductase [Gemmataceae bacterium]